MLPSAVLRGKGEGMYTNEQVSEMSNEAATAIIRRTEHLARGRALSPIGPMAWAQHLDETGRQLQAHAARLSRNPEEKRRMGVDVPDWGMNEGEVFSLGVARVLGAKRERRRALAAVGLAQYP